MAGVAHLGEAPRDEQPVRPVAGDDPAPGVALELVAAADPVVAADRQEPAADPLGVRQRVPDVVDRGVVGPAEPDGPGLAGREPAAADLALDGVDLADDVDHRGVSFVACAVVVAAEAALALAAGELGRERVEPLVPEPAEGVEPVVELVERRRVDGVEPPRAVRPDRREAAVAQDLEVLRDGRLRDAELGLDDRGDRPRGQLAVGEQLEDPAADRVAEDVERVHAATLQSSTYISQD